MKTKLLLGIVSSPLKKSHVGVAVVLPPPEIAAKTGVAVQLPPQQSPLDDFFNGLVGVFLEDLNRSMFQQNLLKEQSLSFTAIHAWGFLCLGMILLFGFVCPSHYGMHNVR